MPYFAIGSAIYLAVIFSFIYRINDQKLIGCLHHIFLSTPSLVTQWDRSLKGGHLVIETRRISSRTVVTVQRRQSNLLLGTYAQTRLFIHALDCVEHWTTANLDTSCGFWHLVRMFNSCNVILLLCIACSRSLDTVHFALFATYGSFAESPIARRFSWATRC